MCAVCIRIEGVFAFRVRDGDGFGGVGRWARSIVTVAAAAVVNEVQ